jgi:hypothetical protein
MPGGSGIRELCVCCGRVLFLAETGCRWHWVLGNHRFRLEKAHLQRRRRTTASSSNMPLSVSVVAVSVLVPRGDRSRPGRELRVEVLRGGGDGDSVPVPGRDQIGGKRTCCAPVNLLRAPTREYRACGRTCYARADLRAAQADLLRHSGLVGRRRRRNPSLGGLVTREQTCNRWHRSGRATPQWTCYARTGLQAACGWTCCIRVIVVTPQRMDSVSRGATFPSLV